MRFIGKVSAVFLLLLLLIFTILFFKNKRSESIENQTFVCGNENQTSYVLKGKELFNSNCAACHKINANSTGPKMSELLSLYQKENGNLYQFLKGETSHLYFNKTTKTQDYIHTVFPNFTKKDISDLEEYINETIIPKQ